MKRTYLVPLLALATGGVFSRAADSPPAAPAPPPLSARVTGVVARVAYEEYVADTLATAERQAVEFAALSKDTSSLSADQARAQLAFLETLGLTRHQLSLSRRAILACPQLSRAEAELLLGELAALKTRWDKLLTEDVPPRKAALVRQIEIAAVAVIPPEPEQPEEYTAAEVLEAASRRLRPSGIASIGGEYHIMLDGRRMRAGETIKVTLDREYVVTLASVSRNSYTLDLDGETLVVPME